MKCDFCKASGANMKRCKKCGKIWCQKCATQGKGPYPLQKAINRCPYCGQYNCIESMLFAH